MKSSLPHPHQRAPLVSAALKGGGIRNLILLIVAYRRVDRPSPVQLRLEPEAEPQPREAAL